MGATESSEAIVKLESDIEPSKWGLAWSDGGMKVGDGGR